MHNEFLGDDYIQTNSLLILIRSAFIWLYQTLSFWYEEKEEEEEEEREKKKNKKKEKKEKKKLNWHMQNNKRTLSSCNMNLLYLYIIYSLNYK